MAYDFDGCGDYKAPPSMAPRTPLHPQDLEVLVTVLELAAIELSPEPAAEFSEVELFALAIEIAGDECPVRASDLRIVLANLGSVRKVRRETYRLA